MYFINFRYFPVLFTCENQSSENGLRPEKGSRSDLENSGAHKGKYQIMVYMFNNIDS